MWTLEWKDANEGLLSSSLEKAEAITTPCSCWVYISSEMKKWKRMDKLRTMRSTIKVKHNKEDKVLTRPKTRPTIERKECPTCRSHFASCRSLRDDPNHDALVLALFGDIDKYEEEELTFHEEVRTRNKEFQASYSKISKRQFKAAKARHDDKQPRRRRNARRRRDEWEREYERTYGNEEQELGNPGTQTSPANSIGTRAAQTSPSNSNDPHGENETEVSQEGDAVSFGSHLEVPSSGDEEMPREGEAISSGSQSEVPPTKVLSSDTACP
ncbi:hypothetical protein ACFE04_021635 [Oxalis oulophora]